MGRIGWPGWPIDSPEYNWSLFLYYFSIQKMVLVNIDQWPTAHLMSGLQLCLKYSAHPNVPPLSKSRKKGIFFADPLSILIFGKKRFRWRLTRRWWSGSMYIQKRLAACCWGYCVKYESKYSHFSKKLLYY